MATAILVDGEFFLRRFEHSFPNLNRDDVRDVVHGLRVLVHWHLILGIDPITVQENLLRKRNPEETNDLYRIFFYDCEPLQKRMHTPLGNVSVNFSETPAAKFRLSLHKELQKLRKIALRLGRLNDGVRWKLTSEATDRLIKERDRFVAVDSDFKIDIIQKGVDMRLGLDVASLAFKKQVNQIIIVSADADFVPAAKLARREGIDVVLDRMGAQNAAKDLIEHVDGIRDCINPDAKMP
jgi:uncharacterized LabA/DUF88 family protein